MVDKILWFIYKMKAAYRFNAYDDSFNDGYRKALKDMEVYIKGLRESNKNPSFIEESKSDDRRNDAS